VHWSREPLPKSAVGKVLRRRVREALLQETAEAAA
jgi:hypothetical protein